MTRRLLARLKANAGRLIAVALVVGVFAFVLPRVADYGEVWDVVSGLSTLDLARSDRGGDPQPPHVRAALDGGAAGPLVRPRARDVAGLDRGVERAARRGRRGHRALVLDVPALGVPGRAGRRRHGATAVFNVFANVVFAVVAAVVARARPASRTRCSRRRRAIGTALLAVAIACSRVALHDDDNARLVGGFAERIANWSCGSPARAGGRLGRAAGGLPARGRRLPERRWLPLTLATLAGHLTVFLVLLVSLRAVGVPAAEVSFAEAFAAWALIRILTTIPITPGGLGVVELGLTGALVSFGGGQRRGRRRGAALPRAHLRAPDRGRRRLPARLAAARRRRAGAAEQRLTLVVAGAP